MSLFISDIVKDQRELRFNPFFIQSLSKSVSCFLIDSGSNSQLHDVILIWADLLCIALLFL